MKQASRWMEKWVEGLTDFLLLCSFFSFLPSRCTLMDHHNQNSHQSSNHFFLPFLLFTSPFSSSFITVSSLLSSHLTAPVCLWFCPLHSLALSGGNCSPLARALQWSRPPSSCFLSPPAEWVSDWPRETREEREEEVTLSFLKLLSLYAWQHVSV